ncbi:MAG: acyloxyacyl hydrolase [Cyclobacteriaceae bacterium]|nr:acyloxyacyl hydrolase [Cyclobacteriaceae bacterium]
MNVIFPTRTLFLSVFFILSLAALAQEKEYTYSIQAAAIKGFIYPHSPDVANLIIDHPVGFSVYLDKKTYGREYWQSKYNYPDIGYSFIYLDYKNPKIGKSLAAMVHYNFYIGNNHLNRSDLRFKLAFGGSYNTNPYRKETNNKNNFLSTSLAYGMQIALDYGFKITDRLGVNSSISIIHFSNASIKQPNKGVNVANISLGASYKLTDQKIEYTTIDKYNFEQKIKYNLVVNGGVNTAPHSGNTPFPFFVFSAYAEKRLSFISAINLGVDGFFNYSLKESIKYDPSLRELEKPDHKRFGVALGHELFINKISILAQFGYYFYDPYHVYSPIYQRFAMKYYFNDKLFATFALKTHYGTAETGEWGIGIKL